MLAVVHPPCRTFVFWLSGSASSQNSNGLQDTGRLFQEFYYFVLKPLEIEPPLNGQEEGQPFLAILLPGCTQGIRSDFFQKELLNRAQAFLEVEKKTLSEAIKEPFTKRVKSEPVQKPKAETTLPMFTRALAKQLELDKRGMMTRSRSAIDDENRRDSKGKAEQQRKSKKRKRE